MSLWPHGKLEKDQLIEMDTAALAQPLRLLADLRVDQLDKPSHLLQDFRFILRAERGRSR